uniref:Haloacid dehalogenase-like hydrolase n=1 Tax=viral metagenome TaxID=1070528 RepID=A0A6C0DSS4_9ZZZZ
MGGRYFIFDMDETLAELYSVYYFIASLRLKGTLEWVNKDEANNITESLNTSLNKAYNNFVEDVLSEEISNEPLGILRPGILDVMKRLYDLQKKGLVKHVLIYSNNGHLQSLEFIRDLIHKHLGTNKLIGECIHWNHHMRDEDRVLGVANKTWNVIKNIMVNGLCNAPSDLRPDNVFFFDDLDHIDLQRALGRNYYKVPAYNFRASFDRIAEIYKEAILSSDVDIDEFIEYIMDIFISTQEDYSKIRDRSINGIIDVFRGMTSGTVKDDVMPPYIDRGIGMMMAAIKKVEGERVGAKRKRFVRISTKKRRGYRRAKTTRKN